MSLTRFPPGQGCRRSPGVWEAASRGSGVEGAPGAFLAHAVLEEGGKADAAHTHARAGPYVTVVRTLSLPHMGSGTARGVASAGSCPSGPVHTLGRCLPWRDRRGLLFRYREEVSGPAIHKQTQQASKASKKSKQAKQAQQASNASP